MRAPSHWLEHRQEHDSDQKDHGYLVEPAIPDVTPAVPVVTEILNQLSAVQMVDHQQGDEPQLDMEPEHLAV